MITAIIPAVVEPDVDKTIRSLLAQTIQPDHIIVAVNNAGGDTSTEDSALAVGSHLVEVRDLGQITGRKAGALNVVLRTLPREGHVMILDADTEVVPGFMERALQDLANPSVGATGAVFGAEEATGYLSLCQRLEWCQPAGTLVSTNSGAIPIEDINEGDAVVGFDVKNKWVRKESTVTGVAVRDYTGHLTTLSVAGESSSYTDEHRCLVRLGDAFTNKHLVYMMRRGESFRIGCTKGTFQSGDHTQFGLGWRIQTEDADDAWILGVFNDRQDALVHEAVMSSRYGIPTALFKAVRDSKNAMGKSELTRIWDELGDLTPRATALLDALGKSIKAPLFNRRGKRGNRVAWMQAIIEVPAAALEDGMLALRLHQAQEVRNKAGQVAQEAWEPVTITREPVTDLPVYSLDVDKTHSYFADGILTHNCRYGEQIERTGKTWVLSGTAGIIKWEALTSVLQRFGRWYDEDSITEDGRLSVDLKVCGWAITSPIACRSTTEVMPTCSLLVKQRTRWFLGALQTVKRSPLTRASAPYLGQQLTLGISLLALWTLLTLTAVTLALGTAQLSIAWSLIGLIFVIERVVTIPDEPPRHKIFAALIVPEMVYALLLQFAFLRAAIQFLARSHGEWAHIEKAS